VLRKFAQTFTWSRVRSIDEGSPVSINNLVRESDAAMIDGCAGDLALIGLKREA
jgi:hypothetical protein